MTITHKKHCDNCKWYSWYYDWCKKFEVEMDARSVHDCFESMDNEKLYKPIQIFNMSGGEMVVRVYTEVKNETD